MAGSEDGDNGNTQTKQRVTTIVLLRVPLGADDLTLILGWFFVVVIAILNLIDVYYGMGRHFAELSYHEQVMLPQILFAFEALYIITVGIIKMSVLLMYRRIFLIRSIKIGSYILGGITLAWMISIELVAIFQCTPIQKGWKPLIEGHCIYLKGALIGNGVPNFVTDIFILSLPVRPVWKLRASLPQRIAIILVFLSGSFVVMASIYRFVLIFQFTEEDVSWTLANPATWCVVEPGAGVISACLSTLTPLVKWFASGLVSTVKSVSGSRAQAPLTSFPADSGKGNFDRLPNHSGEDDNIPLSVVGTKSDGDALGTKPWGLFWK
ncbi:hypothetical protein BO78DRAFT_427501 [Aspergillus sclerotiicarbonarius CBS 121057]|uniref:Rhodopsin domain-containing protein n=1 Tax=Aspergillus sclerotiicarbonarius (strain CBS 121057 / IBT 28362) TaxID=1448318 RepID=A0A319ER14_ASPSB|nr:hypothetical protein BO78DRAFT_427501 [Aspergillus sclerotiicarbonarius CBS 121057]